MRVLILGVTGMLGSALFKHLSSAAELEVWGTLRNARGMRHFHESIHQRLLCGVDVLDQDSLVSVLSRVRPAVVINCVGLIKQLADAQDPLSALPINSMLPHRLASLCGLLEARLIHISTDCVFSGRKGMYVEKDISDAEDLYGKSKYIGEVDGLRNSITLRTSIIGHELDSQLSLIDWFLSQTGSIKGYARAVFSGLPTVEIARVIKSFVLPCPELYGVYNVSAAPIDKFSLLKLVADVYGHSINIVEDRLVCIDRSLDSTRFKNATGYVPPSWPELIRLMRDCR